jgi:hypothetical protein
MKKTLVITLMCLAAVFGCKHPTDVQVQPDPGVDPIQVDPVVPVDPVTYQNSIDSLAITPTDLARFPGFLLVTRTIYDVGSNSNMIASIGSLTSTTVSNVLLTDRTSPITFMGNIVGYPGIRLSPTILAPVTVNGRALMPVAHTIKFGNFQIPAGIQYVGAIPPTARMDTTFTWRAGADTLGAIDLSLMGPRGFTVQAPLGGTIVPRNQSLQLRWTGSGDIMIYLSSYNIQTKQTLPVFKMQPLGTKGRAQIDAMVLQTLPRGLYVLTFIAATRNENYTVSRYNAGILAQAAIVYNSYLDIR